FSPILPHFLITSPLFPGKRFPPSVFLLPPPSEEVAGSSHTLSVTCLVRGFFPDNIDIQWQKNQETPNSGVETG
ncbi:IGHA protein, partial [Smithornis capensis]|nr:IGHA protein [Smithornis capensis]